jgi:hypothetical protein
VLGAWRRWLWSTAQGSLAWQSGRGGRLGERRANKMKPMHQRMIRQFAHTMPQKTGRACARRRATWRRCSIEITRRKESLGRRGRGRGLFHAQAAHRACLKVTVGNLEGMGKWGLWCACVRDSFLQVRTHPSPPWFFPAIGATNNMLARLGSLSDMGKPPRLPLVRPCVRVGTALPTVDLNTPSFFRKTPTHPGLCTALHLPHNAHPPPAQSPHSPLTL